MQIQKVCVSDGDTLETKTINVPVENGEKIISKEPYVLDVINKYRASWGGSTLDDISDFEKSGSGQLIENVTIERTDDKFVIDLNKKYDYQMPVESEPDDVVSSFDVGVKYRIPVAANTKKGINISIKDSIKLAVKNELRAAAVTHSTSNAYSAHIDECINGGYYVTIQGVKCFMPGSTASLYKLKDFESIVGTDMMVIPTMYNMQRDIVVVSHTAFLEAIKPTVLDRVMQEERDSEFTGVVTMRKHEYLLITFNECLAGKLSYADMDDETKELFNRNAIEVEKTELKFKIDYEQNGQLLLTQTFRTRKIWDEKVDEEFKPKSVMDGVVVGNSKKFTLVQLKYGIIGTLPYNENANNGDHLKVKIVSVDKESRKIKLAL